MEGLLDLWDVDYSMGIQAQAKEKDKEEFPTPIWRNCFCISYPEEACIAFIDAKQMSRRSVMNYNASTMGTDESSSEMEGVGQIIGGDGTLSSHRSKAATQMSIILHPHSNQSHSVQPRAFQSTTAGVHSRITSSFSTSRLKEFFGGFLSKAKSTTRLERRKGSQLDLMTCSVISTPGKPLDVSEGIRSSVNMGSNINTTSTLKRTRSLGLIGKRRSRAQLTPSSTMDIGLYSGESHASSIEQLSLIGRSPIPFFSQTAATKGGRSSTVTSVTPQPQTDSSHATSYETNCDDTLSSGYSRHALPTPTTCSGMMVAGGSPFLVLHLNRHSWIRALDSSLTSGRKHCFAITANELSYLNTGQDASSRQRTVVLTFPAEQRMKQWMTCFKRMAKPNLENTRHRENSLKIVIQEAKNLTAKRKYFCDLCLDRCFHARTTTKVAGSDGVLSWYEEFDLKNLVEISHVTINLYVETNGSKRKKRKKASHEKAAYLTLSVNELGRSAWGNMLSVPTQPPTAVNGHDSISMMGTTDATGFLLHSTLFPITSETAAALDHRPHHHHHNPRSGLPSHTEPMACGISLRLEGKYESVEVLPLACYAPLKEIVLYHFDQLVPLLQLSSSAKIKYELGHCLVSIHQRHNSAAEFLASIIREEVVKQGDISLLFRENTMATKSIDAYMQLVGDQYLWSVLEPFTQAMVKCDVVFEVDPTRIRHTNSNASSEAIGSGSHSTTSSHTTGGSNSNLSAAEQKQLDKNQHNLRYYTQEIWDSIVDKGPQMPLEMRRVFARIREVVEPHRGADFCDTLISACVFLRYFTPALYSPSLFGFCDMPTLQANNGRVQRNFTLIAKCLQQLANLSSSFPDKEGYLHFMDDFLRKQAPKMRHYLNSISTGSVAAYDSASITKQSHPISSLGHTSLDDLSSLSSNLSLTPSRVNDFIDLGYELARLHGLLKTHLVDTEKEFATINQSKSSSVSGNDNLRDIRQRVSKVLDIVDQYLDEGSHSSNDSYPYHNAMSTMRNNHNANSRSDANLLLATSVSGDEEKISHLLASSSQHLHSTNSIISNTDNVMATNGGSVFQRSQAINSSLAYPSASVISERRHRRFERTMRYATTTITPASLRSDSKSFEDPWLPREITARQHHLESALNNSVAEQWSQLVATAEKVSPYYTASLPRQSVSHKSAIVPSSPVGFSRVQGPKDAINSVMDNPVYEWSVSSTESSSNTPLATDNSFQTHPLSQPVLVKPSSVTPLARQTSITSQVSGARNPPPRLGISSVIQQRNISGQMTKANPTVPQHPVKPTLNDQLVAGVLEGAMVPPDGNSSNGETTQYEQILSNLQKELENTRLELSFMSEKLEQAESDKRFLQQLLHHDSSTNCDSPLAVIPNEPLKAHGILNSNTSNASTVATSAAGNVLAKSTAQLALAPLPSKLSSGNLYQQTSLHYNYQTPLPQQQSKIYEPVYSSNYTSNQRITSPQHSTASPGRLSQLQLVPWSGPSCSSFSCTTATPLKYSISGGAATQLQQQQQHSISAALPCLPPKRATTAGTSSLLRSLVHEPTQSVPCEPCNNPTHGSLTSSTQIHGQSTAPPLPRRSSHDQRKQQ